MHFFLHLISYEAEISVSLVGVSTFFLEEASCPPRSNKACWLSNLYNFTKWKGDKSFIFIIFCRQKPHSMSPWICSCFILIVQNDSLSFVRWKRKLSYSYVVWFMRCATVNVKLLTYVSLIALFPWLVPCSACHHFYGYLFVEG